MNPALLDLFRRLPESDKQLMLLSLCGRPTEKIFAQLLVIAPEANRILALQIGHRALSRKIGKRQGTHFGD